MPKSGLPISVLSLLTRRVVNVPLSATLDWSWFSSGTLRTAFSWDATTRRTSLERRLPKPGQRHSGQSSVSRGKKSPHWSSSLPAEMRRTACGWSAAPPACCCCCYCLFCCCCCCCCCCRRGPSRCCCRWWRPVRRSWSWCRSWSWRRWPELDSDEATPPWCRPETKKVALQFRLRRNSNRGDWLLKRSSWRGTKISLF